LSRVILRSSRFTRVYDDGSNQFRYRVITDDRNKWSHWSPVINIKRPGIANIQDTGVQVGTANYEIDNNRIIVFWEPFGSANSYDIFFKKKADEDLAYFNTTTNNFIIIPLPMTEKFEFVQSSSTVSVQNDTFTIPGHTFQNGDRGIYCAETPVTPLVRNQFYFIGAVSGNTFSVFNTKEDALANTNKINLQSNVTGNGCWTKEELATVVVQISAYPVPQNPEVDLNPSLRYVQVSDFYPVKSYIQFDD